MKRKPLAGKTVLVTRPRDQAPEFSRQLRRLGARVLEFPTIEIVPPASWDSLDNAVARLDQYHWILFTSANGVDAFFKRLARAGKRPSILRGLRVAAIGPATAGRLRGRGQRVHVIPGEFRAEAVVEALVARIGAERLKGLRFLLPRAREARDVLPRNLRRLGARVDVVEAYRAAPPRDGAIRLRRLLEDEAVDAVTFTSSSTAKNFVRMLHGDRAQRLVQRATIAAIGPVTARTLRTLGLWVHIQPDRYTIPALARAIALYYSS
ncbi:MAG: uroporphyrinogen-III synthase [Acidobacteria bacterium]|nr:uroporphyrinogen-III synthase [Acidobacteriota bacterium]